MSRHYSSCKEINELVTGLVRRGWDVKFGGAHPKLYSPDKAIMVCFPISPSDHRSYMNLRALLRRMGVLDPHHS